MSITDVTDWEKDEYFVGIGTRKKYLYIHPKTRQKAFFKYPRDYDKLGVVALGEVWSEKVAADVGRLIDIPTPNVDIAKNEDTYGSLSYNFLQDEEELTHGAELLGSYAKKADFDPRKATQQTEFDPRDISQHKLEYIIFVLDYYRYAYGINLVNDFIDIVLFDAFIGNTDRHSENWGVIKISDNNYRLAPAYDNSSSLGREFISDNKRLNIINNDALFNEYIGKKCNACMSLEGSDKNVNHFELIKNLLDTKELEKHVRASLARLNSVNEQMIDSILSNIPQDIMSDISKTFTKKILLTRRDILLEIWR